MPRKPHILLMGQTPPPWHGQAVATQILFEHDWPDFEVHRLRMEFSEEMVEVGRFQWKKINHLFQLIEKARQVLRKHPGTILFYPPASAKWIPFIRDVVFLLSVRPHAGATVFIFHASGLPVFIRRGLVRRILGRMAYGRADVSLEVAQEELTPHEAFSSRTSQWCPCAIEVPDLQRIPKSPDAPLTILFVGSLQEGKGIVEILRTASLLKGLGVEAGYRFRIVGKWFSNEFEIDARHLHEELDLGDSVEFVGQLTGNEKWDAYAQADVFFFPSHYASEATPIVLMEALGAGLPIVSTRWAGIPAMLEGCGSATLCPIRSPESYAKALMDLAGNRKHAAELAAVSKRYYHEHFLPRRFIGRVGNAFLTAAEVDRETEISEIRRLEIGDAASDPDLRPSTFRRSDHPSSKSDAHRGPKQPCESHPSAPIAISVYLADQNPGHDRSFGISRMSQVVLEALHHVGNVTIETITSRTSQQAPHQIGPKRILPWGTRRKSVRLLTDHFHPLFSRGDFQPDIHYFPKGYLPLLSAFCRPSVVTIHDTIIQYDEDHYPEWRKPWEYAYWAMMLKHTLREADRILTVSESSRAQILSFMDRHRIPRKQITVTYEPCTYECVSQPLDPEKENYVIHLASCEPHKRSSHLIRWWHEAETAGRRLPTLHLIGSVPDEVASLLASSRSIVKRPFLEDDALKSAYLAAKALILPSEIEGFGLPALEAYYLGTPVCFVQGTSVQEVLGVATPKGGFSLENPETLFSALDQVMGMSAREVRECGLKLRETYAASIVAERMVKVFEEVRG